MTAHFHSGHNFMIHVPGQRMAALFVNVLLFFRLTGLTVLSQETLQAPYVHNLWIY